MSNNIILNTNSSCTLSCHHCGQKSWRSKYPDYHLSIAELEDFLDISEKSGYLFNVILSGGEPLCWKNLEHGLKMLKESKSVNKIVLYTNGTKDLRPVFNYVDRIVLSFYKQSSKNVILGYTGKVQIRNKKLFWPWPPDKIDGTIPGKCICNVKMLLKDEIALCGQAFEIENRYNIDCNEYKVKLGHRFLDTKFLAGKEKICEYCIENIKVQKHFKKVLNLQDN